MAVSLVTYFYGYMNFSLTKSATTLTNFMGTSFLVALFGGFICDTYMTRFKACVLFGCVEFMVCLNNYAIIRKLWTAKILIKNHELLCIIWPILLEKGHACMYHDFRTSWKNMIHHFYQIYIYICVHMSFNEVNMCRFKKKITCNVN
jgi:hypothetical protein